MGLALGWLRDTEERWVRATVVSDSQAGLRALKEGRGGRRCERLAEAQRLGVELGERGKEVAFVWVPSHCGLPGNEMADEGAKRASGEDQAGVGCMFESVKALWKRREVLREFEHERCRSVYGQGMRRELERGWKREEAVSMARLRSGHSLELGGYRVRIGVDGSGWCRRCGEEVLESVEHVMECVAGERKRAELGLYHLSHLCCRPREAKAYWEWWRRVRLKP